MKQITIIFLISIILIISGCELVQERGEIPQFRNVYNVMSIPTDIEGGYIGGGGGGHGGNNVNVLSYTCESSFVDGQCSGEVNPSLYATCSLKPALDCESGNKCVGPFSGSVDICGGDYTAYGWGLCYCVGDGVCDTSYGETIASIDCAECISGETQPCNLPQLPGTCGICNAGLKTCSAEGQWGSCQQVIAPVTEICDNNLDDDCDCSPDLTDSDCYNTHLECDVDSELCVEVGGAGFDQCSVDLECVTPTYLECQSGQCIEINGIGADQCSVDLDCAAPTHLECLNNECIEFSGEGSNQCSANSDCIITHMECIGQTCAEINGAGSDQCSVNLDCTIPAVCGNGILEIDEECDDGNTANGDGCNSNCNFETGLIPIVLRSDSNQAEPAIYGTKVVWNDMRAGNRIYMKDLVNGQEEQLSFVDSGDPRIYNNIVVWEEGYLSDSKIYAYDLNTGIKTLLGSGENPNIWGDKVVWRGTYGWIEGSFHYVTPRTMLYDLSTGQSRFIGDGGIGWDGEPDIYQNKVTYTRYVPALGYRTDVYVYDLTTNQEARITTNSASVGDISLIYGNRVAWEDYRAPEDGAKDIYMYEFSTGYETLLVNGYSYNGIGAFELYGDKLVYQFLGGSIDTLQLLNIPTGQTTQLTEVYDIYSELNPNMWGNRIVWRDYRNGNEDIYMYAL